LTKFEGPARFARRLSAAAARSSAALKVSAGRVYRALVSLRFRLCTTLISGTLRIDKDSSHFASSIVLKPRMSLVVRLRGFGPRFRSAHPTINEHFDQIIDIALAIISISLGDFWVSA
jgi:hypothetical protein